MPDLAAIVKAYDIRGLVPGQLDESVAEAVGSAFVYTLRGRGELVPAVALGRDMRESSEPLARAFAAGVTSRGVDVVDIGLSSTDQLYYASGSLGLPGAMFTASHNPARYNGLKLCRAGAAPVGQHTGLGQIRAMVESGVPPYDGAVGRVHRRDVLADYADYLIRLMDTPGLVRGVAAQARDSAPRLTVVVDAGNGMAGHTAPAVFSRLDVTVVPMYFELDGSFPNHEANPIDPANLVDLQAEVRATGADLGLAFDGDADRCFVVDERGTVVSPSALTALIAVRELQRDPGGTVIHNLITSRAVPEIVTEHGGVPVRTRVGHSFIKATMADSGAVFGGEHSGHFYFRDFWRADSGMLAALHVLAAVATDGRALSALMADYDRYVASGELNMQTSDAGAVLNRVEAVFKSRPGIDTDHLDGLTVSGEGWWFNLRPSNTEPLLRLNVEAPDTTTMHAVRDEVLGLVRA